MAELPPSSPDTVSDSSMVPKAKSPLSFLDTSRIEDHNKSLARELTSMTNDERQAILEELHGVCEPIVEETEFLLSKQRELIDEVSKIRRKQAYDRAQFLSPRCVKDPHLLTQFLRADAFDTREAARRLIRFFDIKQRLWGEEVLVKRVTLDDLSEDDMAAMQTGAFRVTQPDMAGRPLMLLTVNSLNYKAIQDQLRAQWYQIMTALEEENSQRKGLVEVVWNVSTTSECHQRHLALFQAMANLLSALPWRCAAVHYCYDQQFLQASMTLFRPNSGTNCQHRFRAHKGSTEECLRNLQGFGIPPALLSIVGESELDPIENYIEMRRRHEAEHSQCNKIWYPGPTDVLLGRGRPYQEYFGNRLMNEFIEEELAKCRLSGVPIESTAVVEHVLESLRTRNVRFLKRSDDLDEWIIVSEAAARDKVYFAVRIQVRKGWDESDSGANEESKGRKRQKLV